MIVKFKTRQLEACYREYRKANKTYGEQVARKYIQRINIIQQSQNLDELIKLPGLRCHPLKGERKEQYAINLTGFYRLILNAVANY